MGAENFLRCLLNQLVYQLKYTPYLLENSHDRFVQEGGSADLTRALLMTLLEDCCWRFSEVFVVVDAVDECDDDERDKIFTVLDKLWSWGLRILITGRPNAFSLRDRFFKEGTASQQIIAKPHDIEKYLRYKLEDTKGLGEILREKIVEAVTCNVEGQYDSSRVVG
jgi:hypothetical protein